MTPMEICCSYRCAVNPTPVHCISSLCKMLCPQLSAALQDRLAAGLYHCTYTYEDLLFIQAAAINYVRPPSLRDFPILLQRINWVALQLCMSAWLHLARVTCRLADTFVLKLCQPTGHKNA
ncbi:TPA: hypothetical protein ACH3X1_015741 [Trebouxia sp. C0004]